VELLDRKRQLLLHELGQLAVARDETRQRWVISCTEAERWGMRAAALGGASDVALAAGAVGGRAEVDAPWRNTMGVWHPDEPRCTLAVLSPAGAAAANAAVGPAAASYRKALEAAVAHAAMDTSWRLLNVELRATERRLRAIERRRLPALEDTLHRLDLRLDELEREERVVTRWARGHRQEQIFGPASAGEP
jgi:V/A-type H+-transporting ATPase subunit D